jgi:DNA-binding phage protein
VERIKEMKGITVSAKKVKKIQINTKLYEEDLKRNLKNPEFKAAFEREHALHQITQELRERQKNEGLSQRDLAHEVGIRQQELSRLLTGTHNVTIDTLTKVAEGLGKELSIQLR